jgi:hypothetical protein
VQFFVSTQGRVPAEKFNATVPEANVFAKNWSFEFTAIFDCR